MLVSPDGTGLVTLAETNSYTVDAAGRKQTRLTDARANDLDPAWSPKGDRIAYTVEAAGQRQIWVVNDDGRGKLQLTNEVNFSENPNWSPDGSRIVFDSDRAEKGNLGLYSMKPDGTDVRRLTNHPALDALPAYSPDGTRLVFVSDRLQKDSRRLFTMPATGGTVRAVVQGGGARVPDGSRLAAASRLQGGGAADAAGQAVARRRRHGQSRLPTTTEPVPEGGTRTDPRLLPRPAVGLVYRQSWRVHPGGSVEFTPPSVGVWRAVASYLGTQSSAPSRSGWITVTATTPVEAGS
jgi:Tol biopolymer transport system component